MKMTNYLKITLLLCLTFLTPIKFAFILIGLFVTIDTILAMSVKYYVAKKYNLPNPLNSRRFGNIIVKMIVFNLAILSGFVIDHFFADLFSELLPININYITTKIATLLIIIREGMSIDESIRYINDNKGFIYYFEHTYNILLNIKNKILNLFDKKKA